MNEWRREPSHLHGHLPGELYGDKVRLRTIRASEYWVLKEKKQDIIKLLTAKRSLDLNPGDTLLRSRI